MPDDAAAKRITHPFSLPVLEIACCSDIPERAFQNCGYVMLGHTDILLAVWNGRDSGKVGGTFYIIERARQMGISVLCIDAAAPHGAHFIHGATPGLPWREGVQEALHGLLAPHTDGVKRGGGNRNSLITACSRSCCGCTGIFAIRGWIFAAWMCLRI